MSNGIRCMLVRGGTSKGAYFLRDELPTNPSERDEMLLQLMGTPDSRQIDGIGGAHPLTSKVALVGSCDNPRADVEYLFLQLGVNKSTVSDQQNCGNLLAGVAPFAIERGLVEATKNPASVRVLMLNTDSVATASCQVDNGQPIYHGDTTISGVPGSASPIQLDFEDIAGRSCGALLPTGNRVDEIHGVASTLVDNGMPVVVMQAEAMGITGTESCAELEANAALCSNLEDIRLLAGPMMNLGDVAETTVPKLIMVSRPTAGGSISTRTFIPHRCHDAIGVLGAVSLATAALMPGTPANEVLVDGADSADGAVKIEHPTGSFTAVVGLTLDSSGSPVVARASIIRTARKLMDGHVFPREY